MFDLLARAHVALCSQDWREAPVRAPLTADFVYGAWLRAGHHVYASFNNDGNAHAVRDAQRLTHFSKRFQAGAA